MDVIESTQDRGLNSLSHAVSHQRVQRLFNPPAELLATRDDFHTQIVETFTGHFQPGVLVVVGTPHLRSQVRTTSFDSFEFGVELSTHLDLAQGSTRETTAR
jgi:hypothetical protein